MGAAAAGQRPRATGPIYLKTEMGAGHQGPSGRYDAWKDEAFVFAFILDTLGPRPGHLELGAGRRPGRAPPGRPGLPREAALC